MNPYVTREEFLELKSWMVSHFVTKPEFYTLCYKVDLVIQDLSQLRYEFAEFKQDMTEFKQDITEFKQDTKSFRQEMLEFKEQSIQRFDAIFDMLERLDQERIFLHEAVLRIEEKISS